MALEERDTNARPAIKDVVENWDDYDVIFIGCPVWWHEAPMIIHTFAESYDLPRLLKSHLPQIILKDSVQEAAAHQA